MKKILFVCSGNTCRSPLAEGIARKILSNQRRPAYQVLSAGSSAQDGLPASTLSIEVARVHSVDISAHQARLLSRELVRDVDLVIVMAGNHRDTIGVVEPDALEYTYLLTDFCDDDEGDIADPIGKGREMYEKTFERIERCLAAMRDKLDTFNGWKKMRKDDHGAQENG